MIDVTSIPLIEFAGPEDGYFDELFKKMGFLKIESDSGEVYKQNSITFVSYNKEFAQNFYKEHGPSVSSFGFVVGDKKAALEEAVSKECIDVSPRDYLSAIEGVGGSRIFLFDDYEPNPYMGVGLTHIDHLTNNVYSGQMNKWSNFYKDIFGFRLLKQFDIDGAQTGLVSNAMGNNHIAVPINEDKSDKGQIAEYLEQYNGEGVQHIAMCTDDIYYTIEVLRDRGIEFLEIPDTYYEMLEDRIPEHGEDLERMKKNHILLDGKKGSLLLQIFTKPVIGPVFFEIIQRKNNKLFGDGNFKALFQSIEEDQIRRGVLT